MPERYFKQDGEGGLVELSPRELAAVRRVARILGRPWQSVAARPQAVTQALSIDIRNTERGYTVEDGPRDPISMGEV